MLEGENGYEWNIYIARALFEANQDNSAINFMVAAKFKYNNPLEIFTRLQVKSTH